MSDRIMRDGALIYKTYNIPFNPKWFPLVFHLKTMGEANIKEISSSLGFSHPAIILIIKELEKEGLVISYVDEKDKRKRMVKLTDKAHQLIVKMEPVWQKIKATMSQVLKENDIELLKDLQKLETVFDQTSFYHRIMKTPQTTSQVEIRAYSSELKSYFRTLNEEWISKYFEIEPSDLKVLLDPETAIINKGGHILFALDGEEVIGTCALIKNQGNSYELAKMAVTEKARGKKAGEKLGVAILEKAKEIGAEMVYLVSNRTLIPAVKLYEKLGFVEVPMDPNNEYKRSDIKMEIKF